MKKDQLIVIAVLSIIVALPSVVHFSSDLNSNTPIKPMKDYLRSYEYHEQIWIQSNEEFHAQATYESWDGDGSEEDPYIITGYFFDCETQPLRIWHTTMYWIFTDNVIDGVGAAVQCGTWIENVTHGTIVDNEIFNRHAGISIGVSEDVKISNNYIHDCWGTGIELLGGMNRTIIKDNRIENIGAAGIYSSMSRDCVVENNAISRCNSLGIGLIGQSPNCNVTGNEVSDCESKGIMMSQTSDAFVTDNIVTNTTSVGIYMNGASESVVAENKVNNIEGIGLRIDDGNDCSFVENTIWNCTEEGILVRSGNESSIHWNSVTASTRYGVKLETSTSEYSVSFNTFIDNGVTCQIYDDGSHNEVAQNYYDDWKTPDDDEDGYVDSPYSIDGSADNQDDLPLAIAGVIPEPENGDSPLPIGLFLLTGSLCAIVIIGAGLVVRHRR